MNSGTHAQPPSSLAARLQAFRYHPDEDVSGLLPPEVAGGPAPVPAAEALKEYLSFELQETTYAVPLAVVLEILRARPLVEMSGKTPRCR